MWLFPGKGPSQRLGDGNGIFNKWSGKLLIIGPFLGLLFLCSESCSNHLFLLVLNSESKNIEIVSTVLCCFVWNIYCAFVMMPFLLSLLNLLGLRHTLFFLVELPGQMSKKEQVFLTEVLVVNFFLLYTYVCNPHKY